MYKFETVSKDKFFGAVRISWHISRDHDCLSNGLAYLSRDNNIIGISIDEDDIDGDGEFYLVSETESARYYLTPGR